MAGPATDGSRTCSTCPGSRHSSPTVTADGQSVNTVSDVRLCSKITVCSRADHNPDMYSAVKTPDRGLPCICIPTSPSQHQTNRVTKCLLPSPKPSRILIPPIPTLTMHPTAFPAALPPLALLPTPHIHPPTHAQTHPKQTHTPCAPHTSHTRGVRAAAPLVLRLAGVTAAASSASPPAAAAVLLRHRVAAGADWRREPLRPAAAAAASSTSAAASAGSAGASSSNGSSDRPVSVPHKHVGLKQQTGTLRSAGHKAWNVVGRYGQAEQASRQACRSIQLNASSIVSPLKFRRTSNDFPPKVRVCLDGLPICNPAMHHQTCQALERRRRAHPPTWHCCCCSLPAPCSPGLASAGTAIRLDPSLSSSPAASPAWGGCRCSSCPAAACPIVSLSLVPCMLVLIHHWVGTGAAPGARRGARRLQVGSSNSNSDAEGDDSLSRLACILHCLIDAAVPIAAYTASAILTGLLHGHTYRNKQAIKPPAAGLANSKAASCAPSTSPSGSSPLPLAHTHLCPGCEHPASEGSSLHHASCQSTSRRNAHGRHSRSSTRCQPC